MKNLRVLVLSFTLAAVLLACDADENYTGSEYMPDMGHSLALEANTYNYYYYNTWEAESTVELAKLAYPREVPTGTVPRGYASDYTPGMRPPADLDKAELMRGSVVDGDHLNAISVPTNGYVPYYYEDTPEGRERAIAELQDNPFPITEEGLARGGNLYGIFCAICHGESGNGLGYIYDTEQNPYAAYPAAPANFLNAEFKAASNGRYYNAIMHGYNVMGAYKDKINYEERWQVIHYIRLLQARDGKVEYGPDGNTLNAAFGTPLAQFDTKAAREIAEEEAAARAELTGEQLSDNAAAGTAAGSQSLKK